MPFEFSVEYVRFLITAYLVPLGLRLLVAGLILLVGRLAMRLLVRLFDRVAEKRLDDSLRRFLRGVLYMFGMAVVVIAVLEELGVESTAAIAILGAAGLAVGLALQGSLGNFASGVLLILFRPYRVGDVITAAGHTGVVDSIEVFNTVLITGDNRKIIVPNGQITSNSIININAFDTRRVDLVVGIGYGDDIKRAKEVIEAVLAADERVLAEPAPLVAVSALGESSVDLNVRPWVNTPDYWTVRAEIIERVKAELDQAGISIPFPQRDLHIVEPGKLAS